MMVPKIKFTTAIFLLVIAVTAGSCDKRDPGPDGTLKTNCWQLQSTEIWWASPDASDYPPDRVKINAAPFDQVFNDMDGFTVVWTGKEFNINLNLTRDGIATSLKSTWSAFPEYMEPGMKYDFSIESSGSGSNGIIISNPFNPGQPYGNMAGSYRNGVKTVKLSLDTPADPTVSTKKVFAIGISSGKYYFLDYLYYYEWVPE